MAHAGAIGLGLGGIGLEGGLGTGLGLGIGSIGGLGLGGGIAVGTRAVDLYVCRSYYNFLISINLVLNTISVPSLNNYI